MARRGANGKLVRRLHVWTSMVSLVVMLLFGATGILLNHEDWTFGVQPTRASASGTLPANLKQGTGWDTLAVSRQIASDASLKGNVSGNGTSGNQLWITWAAPGYTARATVDVTSGVWKTTSDSQGVIGALDDVHRAKNTGTTWRVVNDLAGALLVFIGITGLLITWLSKAKNRRRDLALAGIGLVLAIVVIWLALG